MSAAERNYLGAEFLTWLFFHLEEHGFILSLPDAFQKSEGPVGGEVTFASGSKALLTRRDTGAGTIRISHMELHDSTELLQALRQRALIDQMELQCSVGYAVYRFSLHAESAAILGLKVEAEESTEGHDGDGPTDNSIEFKIERRMHAVEDVDRIVHTLYERFLTQRLATEWHRKDVLQMNERVKNRLAKFI